MELPLQLGITPFFMFLEVLVSILVLMELPLQQIIIRFEHQTCDQVSILVLMELPLQLPTGLTNIYITTLFQSLF